MFRRSLVLTALMGLCLSLPLRGATWPGDPWDKLEKGLKTLDVENVFYQGYYFVPDDCAGRAGLALPAGGYIVPGSRELDPGFRWSASRDAEPGYTVIRIEGSDQKTCRRFWAQVKAAAGGAAPRSISAWSVEAYTGGGPDDLTRLGLGLVEELGGRLHSIAEYNGAVHLLAFAPWAPEGLTLEEGPVNLNLELYYDSCLERIRIRAGIPVLLSLAHF